jgi:hypothetical protein
MRSCPLQNFPRNYSIDSKAMEKLCIDKIFCTTVAMKQTTMADWTCKQCMGILWKCMFLLKLFCNLWLGNLFSLENLRELKL